MCHANRTQVVRSVHPERQLVAAERAAARQ
jgi:hypothetical protein